MAEPAPWARPWGDSEPGPSSAVELERPARQVAVATLALAGLALLLLLTACRTAGPRPGWDQRGIASWYGEPFHGRQTASGDILCHVGHLNRPLRRAGFP